MNNNTDQQIQTFEKELNRCKFDEREDSELRIELPMKNQPYEMESQLSVLVIKYVYRFP